MGNIIIGTQLEYLRLCGLSLHDVSEGAICWFNMLDSDFTAASASDHHMFLCEFLTQLRLHNGSNNHYDGSHYAAH